jgi:hypothetical protein
MSKFPSWMWVTGMFRGCISAFKTVVKDFSADTIADSGRWNAGDKDEIIEGVRTSTEGSFFLCNDVSAWFGNSDWRSGRNVCSVSIGVRRRVFNRSDKLDGERVAIGCDGYVVDGMIIRERSSKRWFLAP